MFKVDEEFFDLELDDDFFQDAFNVSSKTSTQKSVNAGSAVTFQQSDLEHPAASEDSQGKLSQAQNECDRGSVCASDGPSKIHSSVQRNENNLPPGEVTTVKHGPPNGTKGGLSSDCMGLQPCGIASSAADAHMCKDSDRFPKPSSSNNVRQRNQKKLPFISYEESEDYSVFSFESVEEFSVVNETVEKSANLSVSTHKSQQSVLRKCTQKEASFSGKNSVLKYTSLSKERTASDVSGDFSNNSLLHYSNSELDRTTLAVNIPATNIMNKEANRPQCIKKTPTVPKSVSPFNDLSPGVTNGVHLNVSTPRNKCVSVTRKRKFPGPAGILPELPPGADLSALSEPESPIVKVSPKDVAPQDFVCSQSVVDEFEKQPWQMMLKDTACEGSSASVMDNFNISWVLQQASSKQLPRGKVPVLCILLKNISLQGSEARVTFADKTGEMSGMIHGKILEEYQDKLQPGAVLVLKQVTIFSPSTRKHYLVITPSNIISLYGVLGDKTNVISCSGSELMAMAEEWVQEVVKSPQISAGSMQLFSSNSPCLRRETPSCRHIGLQRSGNSAQLRSSEKFSPKQISHAAGTPQLSQDNAAVHNLVRDESQSSLNSSICLSRNKISPETVIACSTDVSIAGSVNSSIPGSVEQQSSALGSAASKTDVTVEEAALFEDEFDDLFSSLDEDALLNETW